MNSSFKRPEDSPGFLLWQLTNEWQRLQRQALAKLGLTHAQFVVLAGVLWLTKVEGLVTQNKVSEFTKIDKMSMSNLVVTLVNKKMLKRSLSLSDKRAYALSISDKGKKRVLKALPIVEDIDLQFFSEKTANLVLLFKFII